MTSIATHPTTRHESFGNELTIRFDERGEGRPILIVHGASGPQSVTGLADAFAGRGHVIAPTHPGFAGQPRPEWFTDVDDLALTYLDLLERLDLSDVIVVGLSFGGWVVAEMAALNRSRLSGLVLIDAAGIEVENVPLTNMFGRGPGQGQPPANRPPSTPEQDAERAGNREAMGTYTQAHGLTDPKLRRRLASVTLPALVIWGENDTILPPDYGRAYAAALPNARFALIENSGHFPQIDQPERLNALVTAFVDGQAAK